MRAHLKNVGPRTPQNFLRFWIFEAELSDEKKTETGRGKKEGSLSLMLHFPSYSAQPTLLLVLPQIFSLDVALPERKKGKELGNIMLLDFGF